ncbi:MAG: MarR family winged helix-turn-helix transcriptional regulator [Marivibrio sp.]|uniref:MarR family winged helix-turn-helix transcriptional regulator n=1 Tax=Marivibrio sp. TaxID=2039719 RepID=UPI0032EDD859
MKDDYLTVIRLIERLHRQFLEVIKGEIDRLGIRDINNIQALILYNIGEDELTVGELTHRGYYLGSNVSYNVRKMVENGYLIQERSTHDRRSIRVRLSDKGLQVRDKVEEILNEQAGKLGETGINAEQLEFTGQVLNRLERFLLHTYGYGPVR